MNEYIKKLVEKAYGSDYDSNTCQAIAIASAAIEPFISYNFAMDVALLRIMVSVWYEGRTAGLTHALDMLKQI